jgi:lipopolysaccharide/colanic/teichoic acid biosynthesis glycosyltransferase
LARSTARTIALRVAPVERCLFIGNAASEETIRSRMTNHGGVRAEIVAHVDLDEDRRIEGWHRRRLALHPGITGHWQILGPARVSLREMVAIDYLYVANWSLWADVKICLRTVPHVLRRRGL